MWLFSLCVHISMGGTHYLPRKDFFFLSFFFLVISACLEHLSWLEPSNLSLFPNTSGFALGTILASVPPFKQSRLSCPHVCSWHSQPRRGPHTAPPSTVQILSPESPATQSTPVCLPECGAKSWSAGPSLYCHTRTRSNSVQYQHFPSSLFLTWRLP